MPAHFFCLFFFYLFFCNSEASVPFRISKSAGSNGKHWVLLIAGSKGWANYRHQADICHAYHIVRAGGVPAENIIVMMADDIANAQENPNPGVIINRPDGPDLYAGVVKDYTGDDVTAENFLAVVAGNTEKMKNIGSGKVLATGPDDTIFIYFSDHGGVLSLGMPTGPLLKAAHFVDTLKQKALNKGFKKMVLYIEACYSGSIFEGLLPNNLNIYVTTAANARESSWATYCPPDDSPLDTCLGDLYSVAFLENEDIVDQHESLDAQYHVVKTRTSNNNTYSQGSHAMQWGDSQLTTHPVGEFMGTIHGKSKKLLGASADSITPSQQKRGKRHGTNVRQQDAELVHYFYKYLNADGEARFSTLRRLHAEIGLRLWVDDAVNEVVTALLGPERTGDAMLKLRPSGLVADDVQCFSHVLDAWEEQCGVLPQTGLPLTTAFANLCNERVSVDQIVAAIYGVCQRALKMRPHV